MATPTARQKSTGGRQSKVVSVTKRRPIMTPPVANVSEPCPACQPFVAVLQAAYLERCQGINEAGEALLKKIANYIKWYPHHYEKRQGASTSRSLIAVLNLAQEIASLAREALAMQETLKLFNQTAAAQGCPQQSTIKMGAKRNGNLAKVS